MGTIGQPTPYEIVEAKRKYAQEHGQPTEFQPTISSRKQEEEQTPVIQRKGVQVGPGIYMMPRERERPSSAYELTGAEDRDTDDELMETYGTHSVTPMHDPDTVIMQEKSPIEKANEYIGSAIERATGIPSNETEISRHSGIHSELLMQHPVFQIKGPVGDILRVIPKGIEMTREFGVGFVGGARNEPVKTIVTAGVMGGLGAVGPLAESSGVIGTLSKTPVGRMAVETIPTAAKVVLGTLWAQSTVERVSSGALPGSFTYNENKSLTYAANLSALPPPEVMVRTAGRIASTEVLPAIIGYTAGQAIAERVIPSVAIWKKIAAEPDMSGPIRATGQLFRDIKGIESSYREAPDFGQVSNIPTERVPQITEFISSQPHAVFGRATEIGQMPRELFLERGGTKDIDVFMGNPSRAAIEGARILEGQAMGNLVKTSGTAMDIHAFPPDYPIGVPTVEELPYDIMRPAFNPLPQSKADLLFKNSIVQEKLYIQAGRKAVSVFGEVGEPFGPESHRMKDIYDLIRTSDFLAGELKGQIGEKSIVDPGKILGELKYQRIISNAEVLRSYYGNPANVGQYIEGETWAAKIREMPIGGQYAEFP